MKILLSVTGLGYTDIFPVEILLTAKVPVRLRYALAVAIQPASSSATTVNSYSLAGEFGVPEITPVSESRVAMESPYGTCEGSSNDQVTLPVADNTYTYPVYGTPFSASSR